MFGRVCAGGQSCDDETFQNLSIYLEIDGDFNAGTNAVPSSFRMTAALPSDVDLRVEMIVYHALNE